MRPIVLWVVSPTHLGAGVELGTRDDEQDAFEVGAVRSLPMALLSPRGNRRVCRR